jgi:hypothetical protein
MALTSTFKSNTKSIGMPYHGFVKWSRVYWTLEAFRKFRSRLHSLVKTHISNSLFEIVQHRTIHNLVKSGRVTRDHDDIEVVPLRFADRVPEICDLQDGYSIDDLNGRAIFARHFDFLLEWNCDSKHWFYICKFMMTRPDCGWNKTVPHNTSSCDYPIGLNLLPTCSLSI